MDSVLVSRTRINDRTLLHSLDSIQCGISVTVTSTSDLSARLYIPGDE